MILREDLLECNSISKKAAIKDVPFFVSTDSRNFSGKNLFISLFGENFDSINFISDVFSLGCELVILQHRDQNKEKITELIEKHGKDSFIVVDDIFKLLLELGQARSLRYQKSGGILVGLTGSNGKTTNKEILKSLLSFLPLEKVHATQGNLNNQIGVPLTLFDLEDEHEIAIVEMGTSFPGEIKVLAECARPQYGFITNIGYAHIEFLGSLEGVFKEKSALLTEVVKHERGLFLINGFDPFLVRHKGMANTETLDESLLELTAKSFTIKVGGESFEVENAHLRGEHQKINMAMCLSLLSFIYPQKIKEIVDNAKKYSPPGMNRGEIVRSNNVEVYLDAYNANPSSMAASLESYAELLKEKDESFSNSLVVLGDMNELGDEAGPLHAKIGEVLKGLGATQAYFVGRYAEHYVSGFGEGSKTFESTAEVKEYLKENGWPTKHAFIKGSRSLQLESIIDITA